ncbi:unnamed protein product [Closterium sp. NIES-54]
MSGSPRSNNGSSVTSPSRPTASPAADHSHLQQQQQHQYQQQPMYGMPLSSQPVHTTTAAASSTAAAATAATAASTAAAAVPGSSSQPGQQSNFVSTGPYQYQGAYQPANLQQRVNAAVLSLNQMFPTPMSIDGSSYQRGQIPQGSDGSNNSFSFEPAGQGQQAQQGSQAPSLYQLQSADGTRSYIPASANPTKIKTTMPFNGQDSYTWSFEFEFLVQTAGFWQLYDGTSPFPSHGSPLQQATFRSASLTAYTVLVRFSDVTSETASFAPPHSPSRDGGELRDDYSRYTTVFPLRSKGDVTEVLIDWICAARLQLRESFGSDFPVLRLHSDRGGEFSSAHLGAFCRARGIRQTFTLPASPQQNGIAERRIGMVMDFARTSMIHAAAPHFLWPFAVQYAAHQLNLQPRDSVPETSPTLRWTGKVGDASVFRVWGSRAFVRDLSADKLSPRAVPCVFLGFPPDAPGWQFYHPTSRRVLSSQDVTFDESVLPR